MPGDRIFVDTNILIYAHDISAGDKHKKAQKIIGDLWDAGRGVLSVQVLQEFYVCVTGKIPQPMDVGKAKDIVEDLLAWDVVVNNGKSILNAIDIHHRYKYSFWDALIVQAAVEGNAGVLFSEDLSDGQVIGGVKIINPFL